MIDAKVPLVQAGMRKVMRAKVMANEYDLSQRFG